MYIYTFIHIYLSIAISIYTYLYIHRVNSVEPVSPEIGRGSSACVSIKIWLNFSDLCEQCDAFAKHIYTLLFNLLIYVYMYIYIYIYVYIYMYI